MRIGNNYRKISMIGLGLGATLLLVLTGCVAYVDRPPQGSVYIAPPEGDTTMVLQDDYIYYPNYEVYYSNSRHQYAYRDGRSWVSRPAPRGVTIDRLRASPAVRMNFHDAPANHHAATVKQYPRNWAPAHPEHGQNRPDDGHGDNHGK